jgi:hypothetical protein
MSDGQSKLLDGRLETAKRLAKIAKLPAAEDDSAINAIVAALR